MSDGFDLLVRNGLVVDGTGAGPRKATWRSPAAASHPSEN